MYKNITVFLGKIHIHQSGVSLCHESGGTFIQFDEVAGSNPNNICPECYRRYVNIAKMKHIYPVKINSEDKLKLLQSLIN